jgi:Uma2 family endonuclease
MSTAHPVTNATTSPEPLRMSYEEYLAWSGEDGISEWVNGEVIVHMPPKPIHQSLILLLIHLIGTFVDLHNLGKLYVSPIEVKLWPGGPSREPDLVFLSNANRHRITENRIVGPPNLAIEVVSDESIHRDSVEKLNEYQTAGIKEYWLLDNRPGQHRAHFYQLAPDGQYQRITISEDGIYRSAVLPNFWLRVEWLWQEDINFLTALAELIGPDQLADALRRSLEPSEE